MLKKIISFSVNNKLYIILFTIGLIVFGIYELNKLPIDAVPDITNNQIQVITVAPTLGTIDIEKLVTIPVEQINSNIDGIKELRSFSKFGLSVVTIVFEDNIDIYWARQQVNERLSSIIGSIPTELGVPFMAPITTGLGEIYQYILRPEKNYEDQYSLTDLRTLQDWVVRKELLRVKGVAEISSFGGKVKQFDILIDHNRLLSSDVMLSELTNAIEKNNSNSGGTYIEKNSKAYFIRTVGVFQSIEDIQNTTIKQSINGLPIKVKDVAEVRVSSSLRFGALTYNGEREVAGGVLMMLKGANSSKVISDVKEKVKEIQTLLPKGVVIEPFLDRSKMVNNSINTLETNLLEGALIVIFVLILFIGNLRAGLIVASVIPLSLLFAVILMSLFGVSGNLMSLGALDFGLIIDGAVIIIEAVLHKLTHSKIYKNVNTLTKEQLNEEIIFSSSKMMNSATFGQIIILIVYIPIFSLEGIEGKMFKPMAQTITFALLGAFILSLTYIPMMSSLFLSKVLPTTPNLSDRLMNKLTTIYTKNLKKVIRRPLHIIIPSLTLFVVAIYTLSKLGGEFIPVLEEGDLAVEARLLRGSSLNLSIDNVMKAQRILMAKFPEIEKVVGKTGSSEIPTDPMPLETSDIIVVLKDKKEWTSAKTYPELMGKMEKELNKIPGISYSFQFPVQMRFNELMTGARQDVVCKIFGGNIDTLSYYAHKVGKIVEQIQGTNSLYIESVSGQPQIIVQINREAIALYNINIEDVNKLLNLSFAGYKVGNLYEEEKKFDIVIKLDEKIRNNITNIEDMTITNSEGKTIYLKQIADIQMVESYNQIQRENTKRRIMIGFNTHGRDVETVVTELQQKVQSQIQLPLSYQIKYGGSFENLEDAKNRLSIVLPIALLLILLLLYITFNSISKSLLIYSAIPLSIIGGVFALFFRQMPFSISAGIGFIALFGVAVLNGIVLIAEFDKMEKSGIKNKLYIILTGTKVRMRPVLMTAAVASFGFLPMATSTGAGASVQKPLATVVIGGLVVSTFLTLFILPILYLLFDKSFHYSKPKEKTNTKYSPRRNTEVTTLLILISSLVFGLFGNNQILKADTGKKLSFSQSLDSLLTNNLELKVAQSENLYYQKLIDTYLDIPKTDFSFEYGKINSEANDLKLSISQHLTFPTFYSNKKSLLRNDFEAKKLEGNYKLNLLKLKLNETFNSYYLTHSKIELLSSFIQVLEKIDTIAEYRFQKGLINKIEKISFQNLKQTYVNQLSALLNEQQNTVVEFNSLLNNKETYIPDLADWITNLNNFQNNIELLLNLNKHQILNNNTHLKLLNSQLVSQEIQVELEKNGLLPEFSVGVSTMSFHTYNSSSITTNLFEYPSINLGFSLPVYWGNYSHRIESLQQGTEVLKNKIEVNKNELLTRITILNNNIINLRNIKEQTNEFYINNKEIFTLSTINYQAGQISYLELINNINQNTSIGLYLNELNAKLIESIYSIEFIQN